MTFKPIKLLNLSIAASVLVLAFEANASKRSLGSADDNQDGHLSKRARPEAVEVPVTAATVALQLPLIAVISPQDHLRAAARGLADQGDFAQAEGIWRNLLPLSAYLHSDISALFDLLYKQKKYEQAGKFLRTYLNTDSKYFKDFGDRCLKAYGHAAHYHDALDIGARLLEDDKDQSLSFYSLLIFYADKVQNVALRRQYARSAIDLFSDKVHQSSYHLASIYSTVEEKTEEDIQESRGYLLRGVNIVSLERERYFFTSSLCLVSFDLGYYNDAVTYGIEFLSILATRHPGKEIISKFFETVVSALTYAGRGDEIAEFVKKYGAKGRFAPAAGESSSSLEISLGHESEESDSSTESEESDLLDEGSSTEK